MNRLVGFDEFSYNHEKSIYGVAVKGFDFEKVQRIPLERFVFGESRRAAAAMFYLPVMPVRQSPGGRRRLSLRRPAFYHFWNRIPIERRPWAVTFESYLPRFPEGVDTKAMSWALDRLKSPDCRAIIALSHMALRTFQRDHASVAAQVSSKLHVLYPSQASFLSIDAIQKKLDRRRHGLLRVLFVGHEFFRKGGAAVVTAAKELSESSAHVHFDIVSRLDAGDYVTAATSEEARQIAAEIRSLPNVTLTANLPADRLSAMMSSADVLLLPTLDDTFGYSAIEAMSKGTPVISTDVRALPEINPPGAGWQIDLPRGTIHPEHWAGMDAPAGSDARRREVSAVTGHMASQLVSLLLTLAKDENDLRSKSLRAHEHALSNFSPTVHAEKRATIYNRALDSV